MKTSRFVSSLLFIGLLCVLLLAPAKAAMWEAPVGPGESFRWVFVTSLPTEAMVEEIEFYNNFINDLVMSPLSGMPLADIAGKSTLGEVEWKSIASTFLAPNAHDNIGHTSSGIYTLDGIPVAPDTEILLSPSPFFSPITMDELGVSHEGMLAWTGCTIGGNPVMPLGFPESTVGIIGAPDILWLDSFMVFPSVEMFSLYAISEELTVVPVPGALLLAAMGLLSSTLGLKRLRSTH